MELIVSAMLPSAYKPMLEKIKTELPALTQASGIFFKTDSQFKSNMLTLKHPTTIRNIRQILAEVNKSRMALEEAHFKVKKKKIKIEQKRAKILASNVPLDSEMLNVEIQELQCQIDNINDHICGAVRKVAAYVEQYKLLMTKIGKDVLTEEDFEKDEARYHVGTAFTQALIAARARGGVVDEGNHIYMMDIGINGMMAQGEVSDYLQMEIEMIKKGQAPTHEMTLKWLNALMDKYAGCAEKYASTKGISLLTEGACV